MYFYLKNGLIVGINDLSLKHTTVINSANQFHNVIKILPKLSTNNFSLKN